jgi:hypothetical protein
VKRWVVLLLCLGAVLCGAVTSSRAQPAAVPSGSASTPTAAPASSAVPASSAEPASSAVSATSAASASPPVEELTATDEDPNADVTLRFDVSLGALFAGHPLWSGLDGAATLRVELSASARPGEPGIDRVITVDCADARLGRAPIGSPATRRATCGSVQVEKGRSRSVSSSS